ncbi:hypothetical protein GGF46_003833 [Coemansia sp. RSA 552]|nr:hypothetical protein GGF46_003833 [Coemansia sp. RSA 552]
MQSGIKALALASLCLFGSQPVAGLPGNFSRRSISSNDIDAQRGALFVVGDEQTSCEMAIIDSGSAFIAASCLSYLSNGEVDDNVDYRVAVTPVNDEKSGIHSVTMVDIHPKYNPSTYANNIAVLHWGDPDNIKYHQYIAQDRGDWDNTFYSRRTLASVSRKTWNTPAVLTVDGANSANGCSSASHLFNSNQDWFTCVPQTTTSMANSKCQTPYGAVWAVYQPDNMAVAGLYSHSAIYGGDQLCGSTGNQFHYYTMLQPYADWAAKMTGRKVYSFAADSSYSYDGSSSFGMSNSIAPSVFGVETVSGNLYPSARSYNGPAGGASNSDGEEANPPAADNDNVKATPPADDDDDDKDDDKYDDKDDDKGDDDDDDNKSSTDGDNDDGDDDDDTTTDTDTDASADDSKSDSDSSSKPGVGAGVGRENTRTDDDDDDNSYGGMSRGALIAVATAVPIATVIIIISLFFLYKWWRRRQNARTWDPKSEAANIDRIRIIDEINNTAGADNNPRASIPPSYDDHGFNGNFRAAGKS